MKLYNPLNREKILDDYEIKLRSTDQRLQSLEKNNLVLHQRIKTLEEENERLVTSLKRFKETENSHAEKLQLKNVTEDFQRYSVTEKIETADLSPTLGKRSGVNI